MAHLDIEIVDADLVPVADGEPGEMLLSGPGVTAGYLHRDGLTADRFPVLPGRGACYRSGDLARRVDGRLFFVGRTDDQVQIRGYRVEPGEVEAALLEVGGIEAVAVVSEPAGEGTRRLVAHFVAATTVEPTELRRRLAGSLPRHMVPERFVRWDRLPRTANGKTDRRRLADARTPASASTQGAAP
jgi:acyl-CoA synthetase (AMP-forming)/AMP-acid ligase II